MDRFKKYNQKCKSYYLKFRRGKDDKYIEFLENCPNKTEFIRKAIEKALN